MTSAILDDAQAARLEDLAKERDISRDALLSLAITDFLRREDARREIDRINAAHTDPDDDEEAAREEAALTASRRGLFRRSFQTNLDAD